MKIYWKNRTRKGADNLYKHYNLDPDIASKEVVKLKKVYELMEENIDVSNLLPEPDKKDEDNLTHGKKFWRSPSPINSLWEAQVPSIPPVFSSYVPSTEWWGTGPVEPRSEVGNCLGRQAYWGGKLCQGKKRRKGEGESEKIEESEKKRKKETKKDKEKKRS